MIINLRGTNGSGKSTVIFQLLDGRTVEVVDLAHYKSKAGKDRHVEGYHCAELELIVVGRYATACGGCDGIPTQDLICEAVRKASTLAQNVLFEGVIVSTLFSRYSELAKELGNKRFLFAYMDTPLETCLSRIQKRNGGKPIKEDLVASKVRAILSTREKALAAGHTVVDVPHKDATKAILNLIRRKK